MLKNSAGQGLGLPQIPLALALSLFGASAGSAQQQPAEPFTPAARWSSYLHRTYAPSRMGLLGVDTAIDHAMREPSCWDFTASSYGYRYARAFERRVIKNTAELGAGLLTGEDLRYRPSGSPLIHRRVWNALKFAVTAQMPNGTRRPAYSRFFATGVANVTTAQWTHHPIQSAWLAQSLAWSSVDQAETNLLDEFSPDIRRIGMRIWQRVRPGQNHPLVSGFRKLTSSRPAKPRSGVLPLKSSSSQIDE